MPTPEDSLFCLSCDREVPLYLTGDVCFCSAFCQETAAAIRYARGATSHGRRRPWDPLIARTMDDRIAFATGAGFPERRGTLDPAARARLVARDRGTCRRCGRPGTDVAHVDGRSRADTNLELLCRACHEAHAASRLRPIARRRVGAKRGEGLHEAVAEVIATRIRAEPPLRVCDDEETWHLRYRDINGRRRALRRDMAGLIERMGRLGQSGDVVREHLIQQAGRRGLTALIPTIWKSR